MPDAETRAPVRPCERCGPTATCILAPDPSAGPCAGQIRGYYLDVDTRVHVCDAHYAAWEHDA